MVVDSSALMAVLLGEPERDSYITALSEADDPLISAATLLESSIVMHTKIGDDGIADLDRLLSAAAVRCIAVDIRQALVARDAFVHYGKGRGPAALNYGDCFSYALAKVTDRPLLFKGSDFARTDITAAST